MAGEQKKRRLFRLLRRTAKTAQASVSGRTAIDENALWMTHERALGGVRAAAEASQHIASNLAKQRAAVDAVADRSRVASTRAQELSTSFRKLIDLFERLGLVALNAGLEGARLGETAGRALTLVGDDLRAHAMRGGDGARELATALVELSGELGQLNTHVDRAREAWSAATEDAARAAGAAATSETALIEMGERMKKATGTDPLTVRAIADASEHARALVVALGTLSGKVPRGLVVSALRPILEPLSRMLADEDDGDGEVETSE